MAMGVRSCFSMSFQHSHVSVLELIYSALRHTSASLISSFVFSSSSLLRVVLVACKSAPKAITILNLLAFVPLKRHLILPMKEMKSLSNLYS